MLIDSRHDFNFASLVQAISNVQEMMQAQAAHAVNLSLTSRNWLIGMYIVEYEQHGQDRAQYGDQLLKNLASQLHMRGLGERRLYEFRQLYMVYPQLATDVLHHISQNISTKKLRSASAISANTQIEAWQTPSDRLFNRLYLKIDRFHHEYASQLNLYLNYYRHEVMQEDDNPPIGLLLCAGYGETTVRYATEGLENLFVSKYKLQLPSEDDIRQYLLDNIAEEDYKKDN